MENNKISCRNGRVKIVDPNDFGNVSSSSNIPVNNEDLTISVVLSTFKKGRTILTANKEAGTNTFNTQGSVSINFIDGSNINGKQVLTTNYTDLTTIFDDNTTNNAGEGLGITNIDIDFNSQQAPLVTIQFVDVRGSAIFQNEENIMGGKNKYSTFFQLPYPLFKLTIKGYYGLPVEYCLHMHKFNSKFNSQTGNFEITANFIGFTYAMLSDMLIGYLKAIPYTTIGKERYEAINIIRRQNGLADIMNLNDLMIAIAKINESIKKISANDIDAIEITNIENKATSINGITDIMTRLCSQLDIRGNATGIYPYIIKPEVFKPDVTKILAEYKDEIGKKIIEFNTNSNLQLDPKLFDLPWYFPEKTVNMINLEIKGNSNMADTRGYEIIKHIHDADNKLEDKIKDDTKFDCWDLTDIILAIDTIKPKLEEEKKSAKESLGEKVRLKIKEKLNLDPTIRSIIEIFTTAVEVFMESIYTVSTKAEEIPNELRLNQLQPKFTAKGNVDIKNILPSDKTILAWPGYRERKDVDNKEAYIEKYLGAKGVLEKPNDVNEVAFIDDLLAAFLIAASKTDIAKEINNEAETSWFPINPIDTRLFGITEAPYSRIGRNGLSSYKEVANLMLIRGMTFLAYNNVYLTTDEIEQMAEIDTMGMINTVTDTVIKQALGNLSVDDFVKSKGKINGTERSIIQVFNTNQYTYTYFPSGANNYAHKIIPISDGFSATWKKNTKTNIWESDAQSDALFLTNYNTNKNADKKIDGGTYIKIFTDKDYNVPVNLDTSGKPASADTTPTKIVLAKIQVQLASGQQAKDAGFNAFGGGSGIQEYVNMDWGSSDFDNLPLRFLFYQGTSKKRGLANRNVLSATTRYDLGTYSYMGQTYGGDTLEVTKTNSNKTTYFDDTLTASWDVEGGNIIDKVFTNLGSNWKIMTNFDPAKTSYPFVDAKYMQGALEIEYYYSLFGSRFYYGQSLSKYPLYSKALLFLSTIPWNGMPFEKIEILQLFNTRAGFIHVPKLWAAYVGGILWRQSSEAPILSPSDSKVIIGGGSGTIDPIIYKKTTLDVLPPCGVTGKPDAASWVGPNSNQNLNGLRTDVFSASDLESLPDMLLYLPNQVKDEFKKIFFNFVDANSVNIGNSEFSYDFKTLNKSVQLVSDGTINTFDAKLNNLYSHLTENFSTITQYYTDTANITNNFINTDKYQWMVPLSDDGKLARQINLMFKGTAADTSSPVGMIVGMINEEVVIANSGYHIWEKRDTSIRDNSPVYCSKTNFDIYFNKVVEILKAKVSTTAVLEEKKRKEQEMFGSSDENSIKFQLYKTCKNINDKWLGGVTNIDNIIFQCGGATTGVDVGLMKKYRKNDVKTRLIDSFRFVDRAFRDIGDLFYINPTPVNDYLMNSPNTSVFDAISQLIASNHFTFTPLPTFINYKDEATLASMFSTNPNYEEAILSGICGPSFVSVYAGDTSKHLDFGNSEYPNDGIDFQCGGKEKAEILNIPGDFIGTSNDFENDVAVFAVNYSQQNQNIFKDITLDQSEFSETDESLKVTDDIAHKGSENNVSLGGQNIYNVYSVRSYKAEVEMMGNAMIQPMMHFQLNNIPMFHGAYMITRVKHSIKPNYMSTNFTGTRVRYPKTELLSGVDFYMGMLDSLNLSNAGSNTTGTVGIVRRAGDYPPIVATILANEGQNGAIEKGNITMTEIPAIKGVTNLKKGGDSNKMLSEAVPAYVAMLNAFVSYAKANNYPKSADGSYITITSLFRTQAYQQGLWDAQKVHDGSVAIPGRSNHGWGIATDLQMVVQKAFSYNGVTVKAGDLFPIKVAASKGGFDLECNPSLKWFLDNGYKYGFVIPIGLRTPGGRVTEYWHFEYHGTCARKLMQNDPNVFGYTPDLTQPYKPEVINPKGADGKVAVFDTSCKFIHVKGQADGGETPDANKNIKIVPPSADDIAFYKGILTGIGAPASDENLKFFYAWRQAEGGTSNAQYNPFNTTLKSPNTTNFNTAKVKNYPTANAGIDATAKTLKSDRYSNIRNGLINDVGAGKIASEVSELTVWGTGGLVATVLAGRNLKPHPIAKTTTKTV